MFRGTGTHYFHGHIYNGILNMATMSSYRIIIGLKDKTWYVTRPSVLHILTSISEVFQTMIVPC